MPPGPLIKDPDKRRLAMAFAMAGVLVAVIVLTQVVTGATVLPTRQEAQTPHPE